MSSAPKPWTLSPGRKPRLGEDGQVHIILRAHAETDSRGNIVIPPADHETKYTYRISDLRWGHRDDPGDIVLVKIA